MYRPEVMNVPDWHHLPANPYNPHAWVIGEPDIGPSCWIGAFCVLDASGGLTIGERCDISAGAQIYTHTTVRQCLTDREHPIERASSRIGSHTHVGANAVVLMGVDIGSYCVVAAGAVVPTNTVAPDYSLLAGVPAVVVPGGARKFT